MWADPDRLDQVLGQPAGERGAPRRGHGHASRSTWRPVPAPTQAIAVTVTDEGEGIPAEHYPLVFTRFWHGSRRGGTGLGLYIVRGLVEAHGGQIKVGRAPRRRRPVPIYAAGRRPGPRRLTGSAARPPRLPLRPAAAARTAGPQRAG